MNKIFLKKRIKGKSWASFQNNFLPKLGLWARLQIAMLIVFKYKKFDEIDVLPFLKSNILDVEKWVNKNRSPEVCKALNIAASIRTKTQINRQGGRSD